MIAVVEVVVGVVVEVVVEVDVEQVFFVVEALQNLGFRHQRVVQHLIV
jgi:hypothetical protein